MASNEEKHNEASPSKSKTCDVCGLKAFCRSPCGHYYCYSCLHLQKGDKCCLVESCHFDFRDEYDEMYQYTLRTATEDKLRTLPYGMNPDKKCCEEMALVLLMDCYHTLCLSCEDRELKYAGGPNHLIHLKCNKCEVSYLRDSVHHFKQTDLKSISMMKIESSPKCNGCGGKGAMDSHKILLKRCGHVYCIKCSEAVLESSEKETRCKVCDTIISTECFKYMTYILKGKDNVIASAFVLQNGTEEKCCACLELKVCPVSFQECRHYICFECVGKRKVENGFFNCPRIDCTTLLPNKGLRDVFTSQKYMIIPIDPGGLNNEGLCCYRNALFQVLAQTPLPELCPREMVDEPKWLRSLLKILEEIRELKVCPQIYLDDFSRCYHETDGNFPPCTVNDSLSLFLSLMNNIKEAGSRKCGYEDAAKIFQGIMWSQFFCQRCEKSEHDGASVFFNLTFPMIDSNDEMKMSSEQQSLSKYLESTCFEESFEVPNDTTHNAEEGIDQYELFGTIVHIGGLEDGHYYAFVKKKNGKWYRCADTTISEANISCVKRDSPYILFYRRISSSK
ncbi:uncharacterized protein LOC125674576 isoform X2 [Ostrea edulis]|uniref:uncharacterized protein LOC125674576 isoform X2 n=1 Tax=Ostrea edulis TaxID=37623 RepID=UPI0024AFD10C|nr:uncharacterized protein LOC125674576 isoform X2 [Ostrea edulis]